MIDPREDSANCLPGFVAAEVTTDEGVEDPDMLDGDREVRMLVTDEYARRTHMPITLAAANAAKLLVRSAFRDLGRVVGVGVTKIGADYALKVNLERQPPAGSRIPPDIDGVPLKIEITGQPIR